MTAYVGIDLGTTNSAICSYDGETLQLHKSPEQTDVTPSAIYLGKRNNKFIGRLAYENAARDPGSAATLFKRMMGTGTMMKLPGANLELTPEQCSAEVLKVLFGYLPEEMRNNPSTGTVITVPAAFGQMQKEATLSAAELAGIGRVALMQEPVAAVMAVMRQRKSDGIFVVYDFGGGTLDVAIAESISGKVSLLAHGGIAMCGGRDFDLVLFEDVVEPWLRTTFSLSDGFSDSQKFLRLKRMALWAIERAKIELSARADSIISLSEADLGCRDERDAEMYIDVPIDRQRYDQLISAKVEDSIKATSETLAKAGLAARDIERIAFIGGPTKYQPLRERVARELGIAGSTDVDPMTAVAEGAALFAESVDWTSKNRGRKSNKGAIATQSDFGVSLQFLARTPDAKTKLLLKVVSPAAGAEFQVDSLDTGWSSGRIPLKDGSLVDLPLGKGGDNTFKVFLFNNLGAPVRIEPSKLVIARTAATIEGIPSSSSLAFEVQDLSGRRPVLDYLVKEGEPLPKKGSKTFKAAAPLRAGGDGALRFKLWEGDIEDPVTDNNFIGIFSITGKDLEPGVVLPRGAEIICEYEVHDSGNVVFEVAIPSVQGNFQSPLNLYSRQAAQIDFASAGRRIKDDATAMRQNVEKISDRIEDERLGTIASKLEAAESLRADEGDPERAKAAMDQVLQAKKLLSQVRQDRLKDMRRMDLDSCEKFFDEIIRPLAKPSEVTTYETLMATARRAIDRTDSTEFEAKLAELRGRNFDILWRQDWFVVDRLKFRSEESHLFPNQQQFTQLVEEGKQALATDDMTKLRQVVMLLDASRVGPVVADEFMAASNLVRV